MREGRQNAEALNVHWRCVHVIAQSFSNIGVAATDIDHLAVSVPKLVNTNDRGDSLHGPYDQRVPLGVQWHAPHPHTRTFHKPLAPASHKDLLRLGDSHP